MSCVLLESAWLRRAAARTAIAIRSCVRLSVHPSASVCLSHADIVLPELHLAA